MKLEFRSRSEPPSSLLTVITTFNSSKVGAKMAKVEIKSKEAKMRAAMSGGKSKRKKWSKGKVREKLANAIMFDTKLFDRLLAEVPKMKMISVSTVSERLKIGGSLARVGIRELVTRNLVRVVSYHSKAAVYTRATNTDA